jgi:sugar lactone lactonase YvrE
LINKRPHERHFALTVSGLPDGFTVEAQGVAAADGKPVVEVAPDTTRELRVLVMVPNGVVLPASTPITFYVVDTENGEKASTSDFFKTAAAN